MTDYIDVGLPTRIAVTPPDPASPPQNDNDGYPALYEDQRTMLPGAIDCQTAEDVFYRCWAPHLARFQNMEPRIDELNRSVVPYINASRWVAECPACGSGIACWDRNPYACCLGDGCGRIFKVKWQLPALRADVMRLLAGRPVGNRNWDAHKGETVEELKIQNVLMLGVPAEERNGLLVAQNVTVPDNFSDATEYLDNLKQARRKDN